MTAKPISLLSFEEPRFHFLLNSGPKNGFRSAWLIGLRWPLRGAHLMNAMLSLEMEPLRDWSTRFILRSY